MIYEPKLFIIELSGVLSRYKSKEEVMKHIRKIEDYINLIEYDKIHNLALDISITTGCRAVDAFFIATAKLTGSILISNDKIQVQNTRKTNIKSYYLIKEYKKALRGIRSI